MDFKQIQELVKLVNKSNIGELKIEKDNFKITIRQKNQESQQVTYNPSQPLIHTQPMTFQATAQAPEPATKKPDVSESEAKPENTVTIKSPMIGTFYRQAGPGQPVFIGVGDEVKPGDVVCMIEAMKLFNEIESEVSGKIVKVLAEDASPVEFDQPLFLVEVL